MVQEGALTALASVADSSQVHLSNYVLDDLNCLYSSSVLNDTFLLPVIQQEHFQKYYDAVMPYLKAILMNATDKSNRMLRAKAMECISLVGMAVGKEKFREDAKQVNVQTYFAISLYLLPREVKYNHQTENKRQQKNGSDFVARRGTFHCFDFVLFTDFPLVDLEEFSKIFFVDIFSL